MTPWMRVEKFSDVTGFSIRTIYNRINTGHYPKEMISRDGGTPMLNIEVYNEWLKQKQA